VFQLDELHAETQRLESIYKQKLEALADLKQSILQKALSGEPTRQEAAA
jgi:type I restriction enzyme S subunit